MISPSLEVKRLGSQELRRIEPLGRSFASEVNLFGGYDPEIFELGWKPLMDAGLAAVFYTEDGVGNLTAMLGAAFIPDLYCGFPTALAQWVYVDPAHRRTSHFVRLFNAFEAEGAKRNTRKYFVGHKVKYHSETMKKFFERRGYEPGEVLYWRNV